MTSELKSARAFLRREFPQGGRVLCAVSGGLDSMCLLDLAARQPGLEVTAAHFNHRLRGAAADRDEAFVRDICAARGIPFCSGSGDTRGLAAAEGLSMEEAARKLRYAFLEQAAVERGCRAVLTAHHADDSAETMLLNLLRGTGSAGLSGIPAVRDGICRPFLEVTRAELAAYAECHGIPHVEDETNQTDEAARNVLRHQVLPVLRQLNPRAVENMARTAAILAGENRALEALAQRDAARAAETAAGVSLPCRLLTEAPEALAERTVLTLLARTAGQRKDLTHAHVAAVLALARGSRTDLTVSLPYGLTARRERYTVYLERKAAAPEAAPIAPGETVSFGLWRVTLAETPSGPGALALSLPPGVALAVTAWRPGDRMSLPGGRGSRSLKRLCADRGIPPHLRDGLPVLRAAETAAAVPGLGVDGGFAPGAWERAAFVTFIKEKETEERHP
ncbi:tRNA lysidine(34) synthetase TilS [uncultured Oscillibacter sp.]|uniref:tRNA lysidine(34) synthetase TilS n=1 Tax=uncultured Oscillibacter sp. TaxID=876091 RepID=UPI002805C413|nr:tRNA lysidine(34) synthetase TilS [uncultured Oscillibacter sp.]